MITQVSAVSNRVALWRQLIFQCSCRGHFWWELFSLLCSCLNTCIWLIAFGSCSRF